MHEQDNWKLGSQERRQAACDEAVMSTRRLAQDLRLGFSLYESELLPVPGTNETPAIAVPAEETKSAGLSFLKQLLHKAFEPDNLMRGGGGQPL